MGWEFSWWYLIPAALSALYGCTESLSKAAMDFPALRIWASWFTTSLVAAALTAGWSATGFSLPILYILVYLCQAVRLVAKEPVRMQNWFIHNLSYANILTLHLIFIGAAALIQGVTMYGLLTEVFWRVTSVSAVLLILLLEDLCFLRWRDFSSLLLSLAESEEARPFMAFLWFCCGYLLVDSTLCVFELEPLYPPLFLIGSSVALMFTLLRFLLHINALIKSNHLKEEHERLSSRLEAAQESAGTLKELADRDTLTGVFSRRRVMERIDALAGEQAGFSLAFLDLDDLKQINDRQGHSAGDRYLIRFTQELSGHLQQDEMLARVGGDEFVILLPDCDVEAARNRVEGLRRILESDREKGRGFPFSFGVTALPPGAEKSADALFQEADQDMYQDKVQRHREEGRSQYGI